MFISFVDFLSDEIFAALFLSGLYQIREIKVLQETLIRSRAGLSSYFYRKLPEHR